MHSQFVPYFTGSNLNNINAKEILDHHNYARQEFGIQPLSWNIDIARYAQTWADYLSINNDCKMKHSICKDFEGKSLGENLWWGSSYDFFKPIDASIGWLSEKKYYFYQKFGNPTANDIGHYTQMMWHNTKEMGVGVSYCKSGGMMVVANYYPAGNWIGEYPY